jgi:hypothetical protein
MIWSIDKKGWTTLVLTPVESVDLKLGRAVKKITASAKGEFHLTVKLTRKRVNRFA